MKSYLTAMTLAIIFGAEYANAQDLLTKLPYSSSSERILKQLDSIGINNKEVLNFIFTIKKNTSKGAFNFYQTDTSAGELKFSYKFHVDPIPGTEIRQQHLQLIYTPNFIKDTEISAARNSIMINYKFKF